MHLTHLSSHRTAATMVRGFFHSFMAGQAESRRLASPLQPRDYKQLLADNYDTLSARFVSCLFPILLRLTHDNFDEVAADMRRRHFSSSTPPKVLLRYACSSKPLYDTVVAEYRRQMSALLGGRLQPVSEFRSAYPTNESVQRSLQADPAGEPIAGNASYSLPDGGEAVPVALAIRSVVRTQMQSYVLGLSSGTQNPSAPAPHQPTIYRLMIHGMVALLHDATPDLSGDNLEMLFRRAALNSTNFETLMDEMTESYL
ncbi:hypothetical protein [Prevotella dentasini]